MSLEHRFRLSQYLTLGLSCAALVFAEAPFLPELRLCLAPVLVLLLLAWAVEGRWHLSNWGANLLGLLIAAGGVTWLVTQLSDNDFVLAHLPLHLALLPYMGPLSMAALLVKVFRLRDAGHFWHLQGWGLLQIGLGCLLDGGPAFGALMTAYIASDLICLALHYRLTTQQTASRDRRTGSVTCRVNSQPGSLRCRFPGPGSEEHVQFTTFRWLLAFTLRWTLLISATALLLFLLTPRRDGWSWEPLRTLRSGSARGGAGVNEEMNLNNTGRVELDDAVAMHVSAVDSSGQPKLDLSGDQRWRGSVLDWYEEGRWTTIHQMAVRTQRSGQANLPDFGRDQFFLTFTVQPRQAGGLVLAEPIRFGRSPNRLPVVALANRERRRLFLEFSGTVLSQVSGDERGEYRYRQVVPGGDAERVVAEELWADNEIPYLQTLPSPLYAPLHDWTVNLLRRLAQIPHYGLPDGVRAALAQPHPHFHTADHYWEVVARALTDYLAHSGEYTYSLEKLRHDRSLDPVLDFIVNVKQGHCERYAAALAIMLRSVGIPARVIKGYRGCDSQGRGQYVVRHSHAHAWVEALVRRPVDANGRRGSPRWDWLSLDATPVEPAAPASGSSPLTNLWDEAGRFCLQWWRELIVEYNGDEQADLWDTMMSVSTLTFVLNCLLAAAVCVAGILVWRFLPRLSLPRNLFRSWLPRNRPGDFSGAGIYPRLVAILTRYVSLQPRFDQTPREYGAEAQAILQTRPALAVLADLPKRVVELFYRVRYGNQPLSQGERQRMEGELNRLAEVLRHD